MKSNKRWVAAELEPDEYRLLYRLAVRCGLHPTVIVRKAIIAYLESVEEEDMPEDLKFYQDLKRMQRGSDASRALREMAYAYQEDPSEENADMLRENCAIAGFTVDEVLEWINEDRLVPLSGEAQSQTEKAMVWLSRQMETGHEYACNAILAKAKSEGFSKAVVKAAKRRLGIRSARKSSHWAWILTDNGFEAKD